MCPITVLKRASWVDPHVNHVLDIDSYHVQIQMCVLWFFLFKRNSGHGFDI
jgi:hypothetical protein